MGNCHTPLSDKRPIAYVAEIKGLYIYRCIKERLLSRLFGVGGAFRGIIVRGNINLYAAIIALAFSNGKEKTDHDYFP
jgi:hypothetical protein